MIIKTARDASGKQMDLIDEEGRLFGVINVIDALVVLLVLAVMVAGIALVNPFAAAEPATRYATVDLGSQPEYVASQISSGDELAEDAEGNLTVTDVYYTPGDDGDVRVLARVLLRGALSEETQTFQYAGQGLQQGNSLTIQTPEYQVGGTITRLDQNGSALPTTSTPLQLTATVPTVVADSIESGDTVSIAGRDVATVEAVEVAPRNDPTQRHVTLGVQIDGYAADGQLRYANRSVIAGSSIPISTDAYSLRGTIREVGTATIDTGVTEVVMESTLPEDMVEELDVGDTYTVADRNIATIQSLQLYPSGDNERYAVMGVSLRSRLPNGDRYFGANPLKVGTSIPFRPPTYGFKGTITQVGTTDLPITDTDVVLETTVPTTTADSITAGDTVSVQDSTVARIESVQRYPTDNPTRKRIQVGATLRTITREQTPEFRGAPVKLGTAIPLRTNTYDITGTVVRVGDQTPPGDVTQTTIRLQLDNVPPEIADGIQEGMSETRDGTTFATITGKQSEEATVILTSEDGNIYKRQHPVNRDLTLNVTLRTRTTDTGLTFHTRSLQEDTEVVLDLGTITVRGTVIEIQT